MRYAFKTRHVETLTYIVDTDRELTEGDLVFMGGDEWDELVQDADVDTGAEDEDYVPGSLRAL